MRKAWERSSKRHGRSSFDRTPAYCRAACCHRLNAGRPSHHGKRPFRHPQHCPLRWLPSHKSSRGSCLAGIRAHGMPKGDPSPIREGSKPCTKRCHFANTIHQPLARTRASTECRSGLWASDHRLSVAGCCRASHPAGMYPLDWGGWRLFPMFKKSVPSSRKTRLTSLKTSTNLLIYSSGVSSRPI